jgi:hypothetical protein
LALLLYLKRGVRHVPALVSSWAIDLRLERLERVALQLDETSH